MKCSRAKEDVLSREIGNVCTRVFCVVMGDDDYAMELVDKLNTSVLGAYRHEPDNMLTLAEVISVT